MKILGYILFLGGAWFAWASRGDPVQGPLFTPLGCLAAAAGFFMFCEGLKREIVADVRHNANNDPPARPPKED